MPYQVNPHFISIAPILDTLKLVYILQYSSSSSSPMNLIEWCDIVVGSPVLFFSLYRLVRVHLLPRIFPIVLFFSISLIQSDMVASPASRMHHASSI